MIEKITYIESKQFNPYKNLAVEEYLLLHLEDKECILYLWQNENTVVIGKNQNVWKECNISAMENDGAILARRSSGGGAVYHDLGNLNFTFLANADDYDVEKQLDVIVNAVRKLGIEAQKTGRNDITIDGKKFSGNAFYEKDDRCYHHGTIMLNVDTEILSKYLNVSKAKLKSKGVDSVRSRVTNLIEYVPDLTVETLKRALLDAFKEVYGAPLEIREEDTLYSGDIEDRMRKFSSWEWIYGRKLSFEHEFSKRFEWGEISLHFQVEKGIIKEIAVYSDALKTEFFQELPKYLRGLRYQKQYLCTELGLFWSDDPQEEQMMSDIIMWIQTEEF